MRLLYVLLIDGRLKNTIWIAHVRYFKNSKSAVYSFVSDPFADRVRNNAGAYNMYGLLLENQKLLHQAEKAFERLVIKRSVKKHL